MLRGASRYGHGDMLGRILFEQECGKMLDACPPVAGVAKLAIFPSGSVSMINNISAIMPMTVIRGFRECSKVTLPPRQSP